MNLSSLSKYFAYDDKLRRAVSIITGILIVCFNTASGFIIAFMLSEVFLVTNNSGKWSLFMYVFPGVIIGAGILKFCIFIIDLALGGVQIEKYSYIRLVLLISIVLYLLIFIFYITFEMTSVMNFRLNNLFEKLKNRLF